MSIPNISQTFAITTPEIYLVPSIVSSDRKFNVAVWVRDIPSINAIFAYQIRLFFDTAFLECTGAWIPKWIEQWIFSGLTTVSPSPAIDIVRGSVLIGDSILIGSSVSGSGPFLLALFEFQIKSKFKDGILSHVNIHNPDTLLLNDAMEEVPVIIKRGGSFNYISYSPTKNPQENSSSNHLNLDKHYDMVKLQDLFHNGEDPVRLIIGLNDTISNSHAQLESIIAKYNAKIINNVSMKGKIVATTVNITLQQAKSFISEVEAKGISTYVEHARIFKPLMVPNDPYWQYQWGPKRIQADWAWNTTVGNASILVAVVDTGIDYNHPDLRENYVALGYDWVNNDTDPMDDAGHGTHVAGIIAAKLNNAIGIAGLAQVKIMAEKVIDGGDASHIANGIIHATDKGAKIICMSLGGYFHYEILRNAIKYAYEKGVLLVAAAGNDAISCTTYPAYYKEVIAVTATDQNDAPTSFTNFGTWVELAAPGVNITSTMPNGNYANISLIGQSKENTIINGSGPNRGIWVVYAYHADNFRISGFTLQNSGITMQLTFYFYAGVALLESSGCIVSNNTVLNNHEGIYMFNSHNNTVTRNTVVLNEDVGIAALLGNGYHLISNNTVESNLRQGIFTYTTYGDIVSNNVVKGNGFGMLIGSPALVAGNKVVQNTWYGINLGSTSRITVRDNHFRGNGEGINITDASLNSIYHNNFINNMIQVACRGTPLANKWHGLWNVTGNYWSDYTGTDPDGDGIGNTPYIINANNKDNFPFMNPYLPGDINHDGKVSILDVYIISKAYGSYPGHPNWNPRADLNEDAIIDIKDVNIISANYGKTWQDYWGE
jgi:thermitase